MFKKTTNEGFMDCIIEKVQLKEHLILIRFSEYNHILEYPFCVTILILCLIKLLLHEIKFFK